MQVGIDSFAAAFDENSRAVNPAERLRQLEWIRRTLPAMTHQAPWEGSE